MHTEEWSGSRVAAALAALSDAGIPQSRMARMAGVNRSTVNRWSRGEVRPGHDPVRRLAAGVWSRHPAAARELVEASGYTWAQPDPPPSPVPDDVLRVIRHAVARGERSPEWEAEAIGALEAIEREQRGEAQSQPERDAG